MFDIMAVVGFILAGHLIPEMCLLLGSGKRDVPLIINRVSALSAGPISSYFIFGG